MDLMEILAQNPPDKTLKEICTESGFSQSTAHRILSALKERGYVDQDAATFRYHLSYKVFELASSITNRLDLKKEARPILTRLAEEGGDSVYLNTVDKDQCLCLEKFEGSNAMRVLFLQEGARIDLHIGAGPKILMAHLPDDQIKRIIDNIGLKAATPNTITDPLALWEDLMLTRKRGYSLSFGEKTEGAAALGLPLRDRFGDVVAGICISGHASHFQGENFQRLLKMGKEAVAAISRRLLASP